MRFTGLMDVSFYAAAAAADLSDKAFNCQWAVRCAAEDVQRRN